MIEDLLEVRLHTEEDFLVICETLERIGICPKGKNTIYQSCNLLHKQGRYFIVHFLEMFKLDGKHSTITENDILRRNRIARLLQDWELLEIVDPERFKEMSSMSGIKIIPYKDRDKYTLVTKYRIGSK